MNNNGNDYQNTQEWPMGSNTVNTQLHEYRADYSEYGNTIDNAMAWR